MTTVYRVSHRTSYRYEMPVTDAYSVACLLPRDRPWQRVVEATVDATPSPDEFDERTDVFGNRIVQLGVHHRHDSFEIVATSTVEVDPQPPAETSAPWADVAEIARGLRGHDAITIGPYRASTERSSPASRTDLLAALAHEAFVPGRPAAEAVAALSTLIFERFAFDPAATDWTTPLDTVLEERRGVCQDFAHLASAVCRFVGLPAAYISGYIETEPPPGQPKSIGADASHAWCSVWLPSDEGGRWFDIDPTNDQAPPSRHVTVGWGRDYADVAPVRGVVIGPSANQAMDVSVDVARL